VEQRGLAFWEPKETAVLKKMSMAVGLVCILSTAAHAGDCAIRVDRTPMPGKQVEAHSPYGMRNPTVETRPADSVEACKAMAVVNCKIKRKDILSYKAVNALFDGVPIADGADLCK
jgi:hypothetical protein